MKNQISDFQDAVVSDVMHSPVATIVPTVPLADAMRRMYEDGLSCLVVDMDDPAKGHGILTQKDALNLLTDVGGALGGLTVADAMTHPMVVLQPTYSVATCLQLMRMVGVRRAAVVRGTSVVGIVSFTDIFRFAVEAGGYLEPVEADARE